MTSDDTLLEAALQRCESEAIHRLGLLQSCGALVTVAAAAPHVILRASENLHQFFPWSAHDALGMPLEALLGSEQAAEVGEAALKCVSHQRSSVLVYAVVNDVILELQTSLHYSGEELVLEFEPVDIPYQSRQLIELFESARHTIQSISGDAGLQASLQSVAELVRAISGFERVMLYKFDEQWDGEVVAESCATGITSYLGHRFPAGDIPPQARALYTKNLIRFVMDAEQAAVPICTHLPPENPLDQTYCVLRAFSPVHVSYLRNMGVRASLSVSLVYRGQLWGLIACHNQAPLAVAHPVRDFLEFVGNMFALKIAAVEGDIRAQIAGRLDEVIINLSRDLVTLDQLPLSLHKNQGRLLELMDATTFLVRYNGLVQHVGQDVSPELVQQIGTRMASLPEGECFSSMSLAEEFPVAGTRFDGCAGVLAYSFGVARDNFCCWIRPEKIRQVSWAGNPQKKWEVDTQGVARICPRQSFNTWNEIWHGRSTPWIHRELEAAELFSRSLFEALDSLDIRERQEFHKIFGDVQGTEVHSRHDAASRFIQVSSGAHSLFASAQGAMPASLADLAIDEDKTIVREAFASLTHGETQHVSYRVHRNGVLHWLDSSLRYAGVDPGQPEIMAITRDVTDQQSFRYAVEKYQQKSRELFNFSDEAILTIDTHGIVTHANEVAGELLGWLPQELVGRHAHDTIHHHHPDGQVFNAADCPTTKLLKSGTPFLSRRDRYFRQDGSSFEVYAGTSPLIQNGAITGAVVLFVSLETEYGVNPLVKSHSVSSIMTLDTDGRITSFNQSLSEMTGYAEAEVIGQPVSIFRSKMHTHVFFADLWKHLKSEGCWRGLIWNRCKDGETRPFWVSLHAIADGSGNIDQYVGIYGLLNPEQILEGETAYLATHDRLTSLVNRNQFGLNLKQAIARALRKGEKLAVGFVDLDRFKAINDCYGHLAGDAFLKEIARRMATNMREEDTVARWGGDEFVFFLESHDGETDCNRFAQRLLAEISRPVTLGEHLVQAAASIGIALFPEHGTNAGELIHKADKAMYLAKNEGRAGIRLYSDTTHHEP